MIVDGTSVDLNAYEMIAAGSAASFDVVEELPRIRNELLDERLVKDYIRPEMAVVEDD